MHSLYTPPLFHELAESERVLVAGAGGGFDVYAGLPLYLALQDLGKEVWLANLSFTALRATTSEPITPTCRRVVATDRRTDGSDYFPEKYLAEWFLTQDRQISIYAFERTGVVPLTDAYKVLIDRHEIDAILVADGGTDSLMLGDEEGLGTPVEDSTTLAAVSQTDVRRALLVCIGFGVDHFHGVSHAHFLENVARFAKEGGYLGAFSLPKEAEVYQHYRAAVAYAHRRGPGRPSIVSSSIVRAIEGDYGDVHSTERTRGSELYLNPLMGLYWSFDLFAVARRVTYLDRILNSRTANEVEMGIAAYRRSLPSVRPRQSIPL